MNVASTCHTSAIRGREAAVDYEHSFITVILFPGAGRAGGLQGRGHRQSWRGEPRAGVSLCCMDVKVSTEQAVLLVL